MITSLRAGTSRRGFTLLEMVIVLGITAMLLTAMYSISQGTITLADDIEKHQRRERRLYSYIDFCQHLFSNLPASAAMNLKTTQDGSSYLCTLEFQNVRSPFDGAPQQIVTLKTATLAGGGLKLILTSQKMPDPQVLPGHSSHPLTQVVLLDNLAQYEWRAFDTASGQWTSTWREQLPNLMTAPPTPPAGVVQGTGGAAGTAVAGGVVAGNINVANPNTVGNAAAVPVMDTAVRSLHPLMLELKMASGIDPPHRWVFWIPPSEQPMR
ncbi:type II secretion system protein J [Prosthecobacter sp.]|uniref:type II secretion system protein J n=1 Tax=Prosthecobacter sp. TaxID=1965333 RepID=UPI0037835789